MTSLRLVRSVLVILTFLVCSGSHVLKDKRTGKYVNDFQPAAAGETLIENAKKAGLGNQDDFEVQEVDETKFLQIQNATLAPIKATLEAEKAQEKIKKEAEENTILQKLGITRKEMEKLLNVR